MYPIPLHLFSIYILILLKFCSFYPHPSSALLIFSQSPFSPSNCILIPLQLFSLYPNPPSVILTVSSSLFSLVHYIQDHPPFSSSHSVSSSPFSSCNGITVTLHCIIIPFQLFSLYPHPPSALFTISSSPFMQLFSLYPHPPSVVLTVSPSPFSSSHCILILIQLFPLYPHPPSALLAVFSFPFNSSHCILIPSISLRSFCCIIILFITSQCILFPFLLTVPSSPFLCSLNPNSPLFIFPFFSSPFGYFSPLSMLIADPPPSALFTVSCSIFISFQCTVSSIASRLFSMYPFNFLLLFILIHSKSNKQQLNSLFLCNSVWTRLVFAVSDSIYHLKGQYIKK